jgi:hypothetical protein
MMTKETPYLEEAVAVAVMVIVTVTVTVTVEKRDQDQSLVILVGSLIAAAAAGAVVDAGPHTRQKLLDGTRSSMGDR